MNIFRDRVDAGRQLARRLLPLAAPDVTVVGLPRGGVVVAAEVARAMDAPLDVIVVRKLGIPTQPEVAMGAIGEDGTRVLDETTVDRARVTNDELEEVERRERRDLERRVALLRGHRARCDLRGRTVIIVDDGVATGATARVACEVARSLGAARVVLAVPVGPPEITGSALGADELVCLYAPDDFRAVGQYYDEFSSTSDEEVVSLLDHADGADG